MINMWRLKTAVPTRENGKNMTIIIDLFHRLATTKEEVKEGVGVMFWPDGTKYEGGFHKDQPHGYGRKIFANGEYYEGYFECGKANGKGTFQDLSGGKYEGDWKDDK